jgi:glycosidase
MEVLSLVKTSVSIVEVLLRELKLNLIILLVLGFDAIWISPISKNKVDDYHGYAALNWNEINEHFGTK